MEELCEDDFTEKKVGKHEERTLKWNKGKDSVWVQVVKMNKQKKSRKKTKAKKRKAEDLKKQAQAKEITEENQSKEEKGGGFEKTSTSKKKKRILDALRAQGDDASMWEMLFDQKSDKEMAE